MYRKSQTKYALSGKVFCKKHKCSFVRKVKHYKKKDDVIFWYCSDFHKTGKKNCDIPCLTQEELYDILLNVLKKYEAYKVQVCEELLSIYKECNNCEDNSNQEKKLKNELNILNNKYYKLVDLVLEGILSKEHFAQKKDFLEEQIKQIKLQLEKLNTKEILLKEDNSLKEHILNELVITKDNLESYIEEMLDKIIVLENEENKIKVILAGEKMEERISNENNISCGR